MEDLLRMREDTGGAARNPRQQDPYKRPPDRKPPAKATPAKKTPPPATGREREYKRDPKGSHTGGRFTENPSGGSSKPSASGGGAKPALGKPSNTDRGTKRRTPPPLEFGAKNDPDRVKFLQRLLKSLKIANLAEDGTYGEQTERAVMALQRKLGLTETGRVSNGLLKRIRDAEILSPCAAGAKRSKEMDEMEEILRSIGLVEDEETDEDEVRSLTRCCPSEHTFAREWPLDDIVIRSGGDGRTVEAYAAPFDVATEIKDQHGHYMETIDRAAFNEAIAGGIHKIGCFYHHGMTLHGTPSDLGSVPIGSPLEVKADGRGLHTITRFNKSELADAVLEAIRAGDLKGYSFRGPIRKSNPPRIARARAGQPLPQVVRMTLGLNEYGPTPTPYYADAKILAVRSAQQVAEYVSSLDPAIRRETITILSRATPQDQARDTATPTEGPGAEDQHDVHSGRQLSDIALRIARAKILLRSRP